MCCQDGARTLGFRKRKRRLRSLARTVLLLSLLLERHARPGPYSHGHRPRGVPGRGRLRQLPLHLSGAPLVTPSEEEKVGRLGAARADELARQQLAEAQLQHLGDEARPSAPLTASAGCLPAFGVMERCDGCRERGGRLPSDGRKESRRGPPRKRPSRWKAVSRCVCVYERWRCPWASSCLPLALAEGWSIVAQVSWRRRAGQRNEISRGAGDARRG